MTRYERTELEFMEAAVGVVNLTKRLPIYEIVPEIHLQNRFRSGGDWAAASPVWQAQPQ